LLPSLLRGSVYERLGWNKNQKLSYAFPPRTDGNEKLYGDFKKIIGYNGNNIHKDYIL